MGLIDRHRVAVKAPWRIARLRACADFLPANGIVCCLAPGRGLGRAAPRQRRRGALAFELRLHVVGGSDNGLCCTFNAEL